MKTFVKILLFVSFIMSFIFVGGMVVDGRDEWTSDS